MRTSAQKYNDKMNKIFAPQISKMQKQESIADEILTKLESMVDIDPCGLDRCHLINAISRILQTKTDAK